MTDLNLTAYLEELEAQRVNLDVLIASIRNRLGMPSEPGGGLAPTATTNGASAAKPIITGRVRPDEFFRMSIPEAVKRYLEIMKQPQAPTAIVSALKAGGVLSQSKNFYTTVWTAMKRLRTAGEITNTPTGWALSDWYAGRSGGTVETKPKRATRRKG